MGVSKKPTRYDHLPHQVFLLRSRMFDNAILDWFRDSLRKCETAFGPKGPQWDYNRAYGFYFASHRDAIWFLMACEPTVAEIARF